MLHGMPLCSAACDRVTLLAPHTHLTAKKAGFPSLNLPQQLAHFGMLPNFTQVTDGLFPETAGHSHNENYRAAKCRVPNMF